MLVCVVILSLVQIVIDECPNLQFVHEDHELLLLRGGVAGGAEVGCCMPCDE